MFREEPLSDSSVARAELSKQNSKEALDEGSRGPRLLSLPEWAQAGSRFSAGRVTRISSFNLVLRIANAAFCSLVGTRLQFAVFFFWRRRDCSGAGRWSIF